MKYDKLPWKNSCCGLHRLATIVVGVERIDIREISDDEVYFQSIVDGDYFTDSKIVPGGRMWVKPDDAKVAVANVVPK